MNERRTRFKIVSRTIVSLTARFTFVCLPWPQPWPPPCECWLVRTLPPDPPRQSHSHPPPLVSPASVVVPYQRARARAQLSACFQDVDWPMAMATSWLRDLLMSERQTVHTTPLGDPAPSMCAGNTPYMRAGNTRAGCTHQISAQVSVGRRP